MLQTEAELETAMRTVLAAAADPGESISKADLLQLVLDFANQGILAGALLRVPGLHLPRAVFDAGMKSIVVTGATDGEGNKVDGLFPRLQDQLNKDLLSIARHRLAAARLTEIRKAAARMVLIPRYPSTGAVQYHHLPENHEAVFSYTLILLLRDEHEVGGIGQCRLPGCDAFYLRRLRPKRSPYCTDEHSTQARKAAGAARQRKLRGDPIAKPTPRRHK